MVLNEGAVIIRRPGRAETSSSESEEEEEEEVAPKEPEQVKPEEPPPRDPLEVEEEMLNEKLQTAGFFLSMPEEEQIKKRLLEIKQMRENPELFTPENTKVLTEFYNILLLEDYSKTLHKHCSCVYVNWEKLEKYGNYR